MTQPEQLQQQALTTVADTENTSEFLQTRPFAPVAKHTSSSAQGIQPKANSSSGFGHSFGNLAVFPPTRSVIQPKLTIGQPGDKYEQEADRVAADVVQRINQPQVVSPKQQGTVQRQELPQEEELQMKPLADSIQRMEAPDEEELQMKPLVQRRETTDKEQASTDLESSINSARSGGQPMSPTLKEPMEQAFGADFSGVRVHTGAQADHLARSIQAKAFTTGQDVFFRQGAYEPGSRGGQELMAHELTHVVQQNGSAVQQMLSKKVEETTLNIQADKQPLETIPEDAELGNKLETIPEDAELDVEDNNEQIENISEDAELDIEDNNEQIENISEDAELDVEDNNKQIENIPEDDELDVEVNNEQEQPKQDSEPVNSQKDPGKVTIDGNLKRVGNYYKAIEINTLDFEKKYYAFLEDQEALETIFQYLGDLPDKAKDSKYVDKVINKLEAEASEKNKSEEEKEKINEKIGYLKDAQPYLQYLNNIENEQTTTAKSVDDTGQSWKEAQKSQLFVGFVYEEIQKYRKDYSKWSGNIKTKSLSETEQKEKAEAKAKTKVMADEAELHFDEIERRSGDIKKRKKELIDANRLLPEFADDWKKWFAAKFGTKFKETIYDTIVGTVTLGLVRFEYKTNARGKVDKGAKNIENYVFLNSLRKTANSIVREFKVIQTLKKGDSSFVDKVVTGLQFLEMFLENVKRVCRYTSLTCSLLSLIPGVAPILGPVAAITGIISVMTSAAQVPVTLLIAMIRGLQVVANDAKLSNAMKASATTGAVKSLGAAMSLGTNIASDFASSAIKNENYDPINSNSPSVIKDSVHELQNGGDKDSKAESIDTKVKSHSTKTGIKVANNLGKTLLDEGVKNIHKPYKLFGSVKKGNIEGPLSGKDSKHEEDVSNLYKEMLVNRQAKVAELTTQLLDKIRPIQEKNASVSAALANAAKVASSEKAQEQDKSPEEQISPEDTNVLNESQQSFDESFIALTEMEKGLQVLL